MDDVWQEALATSFVTCVSSAEYKTFYLKNNFEQYQYLLSTAALIKPGIFAVAHLHLH